MVSRCLRDAGESRLGGLETGHGAHIVETVEDLVVEHQLRFMLRVRQVVPHIWTLTTQGHTFEITPLENISPHLVEAIVKDNHQNGALSYRLCDMRTLNALPIVANNRSLCTEILLPLRPAASNACFKNWRPKDIVLANFTDDKEKPSNVDP